MALWLPYLNKPGKIDLASDAMHGEIKNNGDWLL